MSIEFIRAKPRTVLTDAFIPLVKYFHPNVEIIKAEEPVIQHGLNIVQMYSRMYNGSLEDAAKEICDDTTKTLFLLEVVGDVDDLFCGEIIIRMNKE